MAQRSIGSVTITLGLLNIPIKIYTSARAETIAFKRMTKEGNLTSQKIFDKVTNEEVAQGDLGKAYEYSKGKYLQFSKKEIESLASAKVKTATIEQFVPYDTVDMLNVEKNMHLGPDKGADNGYLLLAAAMKAKGVAAVAKWYSIDKERLVVIAPRGDGLVMHQMFYVNEVRTFNNPCAKLPISDQELELVGTMIDQVMVNTYGKEVLEEGKPELYRDNYIDRVWDAVQIKRFGGTLKNNQVEEATLRGSLMDILRDSINALKSKAS